MHGDDGGPVHLDALDGHAGANDRAMAPSTRCISVDDRLRAAVAIAWMERRSEQVVDDDSGGELMRLARGEEPALDAHAVLELDGLLVGGEVACLGDDEQVADLVQVDGPPRALMEVLEGLEAACAEFDVHRIGELRSDPARSLRGRAAREQPALEQEHILDTGLGEVERGTRAHDAAADDDDTRTRRKRGIRRDRHPKFTPWASGRLVE